MRIKCDVVLKLSCSSLSKTLTKIFGDLLLIENQSKPFQFFYGFSSMIFQACFEAILITKTIVIEVFEMWWNFSISVLLLDITSSGLEYKLGATLIFELTGS